MLAAHPHVIRTEWGRELNAKEIGPPRADSEMGHSLLDENMKIVITGIFIVVGLLFTGLYFLATIDDEEGGTDLPVSNKVAEAVCQMGFPEVATDIYCRWWTGGTQEWKHEARFDIPKGKEKDFIDSLLFDRKFQMGERLQKQSDLRLEYARKRGPRKKWWGIGEGFQGIYLGVTNEFMHCDNYWIDTTNHRVYLISNQ